MPRIKIAEIPNKLESYWDDEMLCIINCWKDFHGVTISDIQTVLINQVLQFAKEKKCKVHVVDNSKAIGSFSKEVSNFISNQVSEDMKNTGLIFFITVESKKSAITNISMRNLENKEIKQMIHFINTQSLKEGFKKAKKLEEEYQDIKKVS